MCKSYYAMDEVPPIRVYAFLGITEVFVAKLRYLAALALEESWYYDNPNFSDSSQKQVGVLYQYIFHTFTKARDDNKLLETQTNSIFNTGLISKGGQDIYMLFSINRINKPSAPKWFFNSFYEASALEIPSDMRGSLPTCVDYFEGCPELMYFDPKIPILGNINHIVKERMDRFPENIIKLADDEALIVALIQSSANLMVKHIKRNNRLVLVQYWNKRIMYLAPLYIGEDVLAVAIERHATSYRINTVLTLDMAYCNARLINRPQSSWLKPIEP